MINYSESERFLINNEFTSCLSFDPIDYYNTSVLKNNNNNKLVYTSELISNIEQ